MFERRVLNNQFGIDLYVKALRHYKRYFEISGGKSAIVSDSDEEFDSGEYLHNAFIILNMLIIIILISISFNLRPSKIASSREEKGSKYCPFKYNECLNKILLKDISLSYYL